MLIIPWKLEIIYNNARQSLYVSIYILYSGELRYVVSQRVISVCIITASYYIKVALQTFFRPIIV